MGNVKNIYSVSQVNSYIKNMFLQDFMLRSVRVRGELSNVKYHSSGHIYFTLKDGKSAVSAVMFAGNRKGLQCQLIEGMQVVCEGSVDVYERDGRYQLYAREISKDGIGALYERFLAMKKEMEEMGMFAPDYKKPIPAFIHTLGVVTAPTGAAVQDIINITNRRNPYVQIVLYPAIVQGEAAATSIIKGIKALEAMQVDVMIVGRGGGSMEDLWAFNLPDVAQAIFDCSVPIISAVGHETDTTIADYVADLRAPTPSAAAELAVTQVDAILDSLQSYRVKFTQTIRQKCQMEKLRGQNIRQRLRILSPMNQVREKRTHLMQLEEHMKESMRQKLLQCRHRQAILIEQYKGMSPLNKLSQGFSYVEKEDGTCLKDAANVMPQENIKIHLYKGSISAVVTEVNLANAQSEES